MDIEEAIEILEKWNFRVEEDEVENIFHINDIYCNLNDVETIKRVGYDDYYDITAPSYLELKVDGCELIFWEDGDIWISSRTSSIQAHDVRG